MVCTKRSIHDRSKDQVTRPKVLVLFVLRLIVRGLLLYPPLTERDKKMARSRPLLLLRTAIII